jgi:hypothetical protein
MQQRRASSRDLSRRPVTGNMAATATGTTIRKKAIASTT